MCKRIETLEQLHTALKELDEFLMKNGASDEGAFRAKLAVSELASNAIRHTASGNALVKWWLEGELCELEITSLPPFDLPKNCKCADVMAESGRGLYLVHNMIEKCVLAENGALRITVRIKEDKL